MAETGKSFIKKFVGFSILPWVTFILTFISAPISTRLFDPDVHGKINIFHTYSQLIGLLVLIGLDQAYARFYNERPNNRSKGYLFTFCFAITYAVIFVLFVVALPIRDWLSLTLFDETDNVMLGLLFVSVFCTATLRYLNLTYRMEQDIKMYTIQGILNALVSRVLYIGVGFWNPTYKPALTVLAISHFLLAMTFLFIQRKRFGPLREFDKTFSSEMFKFALPLIPVSVLSWANSSIPQVIMQKTMDYYSIGIFSSAMALANVILVIQSGFNTFWVPYTYENYKIQKGQFFKVHRYLVCALTLFAILLVCGQDLVFLLLGPKYRAAKAFFPFLILGPVCYVMGEVSGVGIDISKKTYLNLYVFVSSIAVNIVLCLLLRIPFGVAGIAMATCMAAITSMLVKTYLGSKYYKVVTNFKYTFFCIASIIAVASFTLWIQSVPLRLALSFLVLICGLVFFRIEIRELWKVAIGFVKKRKNE
ncbi:MAG: oligosaccharide flippase family protein [Paludibacteraceae bacterium]|nr:oligosaccharide flippase family protein [Paludibacteraceae bacterium]